jgi:small subunit ribosomal protein S8
VLASKTKTAIVQILLDEGYISKYFLLVKKNNQYVLRIRLKYTSNKKPVIAGIKRVSKPGLRIYTNVENMPKVIRGLGIAIISTSKGIMTDRKARRENVGGEIMAYVW